STETQAPPVNTVTLTIDEQPVTVPKGTLLIEAAKQIGIDIPFLCYHHKLTPFGGCRLCLVEVEKARSMLAACNTTVMDGMVVRDPVLEFGQRGVSTEVYTFEHEHFPAGFSGNTIKVCPVGALMSKPFRFKARPWELVKTPSVCSLCSMGCSLREDMRENKIM